MLKVSTTEQKLAVSSDPIDIQLSGQDIKQLQQLANQVKGQLQFYPNVFDIADNLSNG